jgi:hypothetical protein
MAETIAFTLNDKPVSVIDAIPSAATAMKGEKA